MVKQKVLSWNYQLTHFPLQLPVMEGSYYRHEMYQEINSFLKESTMHPLHDVQNSRTYSVMIDYLSQQLQEIERKKSLISFSFSNMWVGLDELFTRRRMQLSSLRLVNLDDFKSKIQDAMIRVMKVINFVSTY